MRHWEARAAEIEDPELRALALEKLRNEGFNAEAAAMAATIAPRASREHAVRAIVALELLFDYLDGLTERPHADPLSEGKRLYAAFVGALDPGTARADQARDGQAAKHHPQGSPGEPGEEQALEPYLRELADTVQAALAELPAREAVAPVARQAAARGAQAQTRMHATPLLGKAQLGEWARSQARDTELGWREFAAGAACSVLALHALIAAAADPRTTVADAQEIDSAYLFTGAMVTLLDGVVDRERDAETGALSYVALYDDQAMLTQALAQAAREATRRSGELRNGAHHLMTLAAAMAYWHSAPGARDKLAQPMLAHMREEMGPLVLPPLLAMRIWRAARAMNPRRRKAASDAQPLLSC